MRLGLFAHFHIFSGVFTPDNGLSGGSISQSCELYEDVERVRQESWTTDYKVQSKKNVSLGGLLYPSYIPS